MKKIFLFSFVLLFACSAFAQQSSNLKLDFIEIEKVTPLEEAKDLDWIYYCGDPYTGIGTGDNSGDFGCFMYISANDLATHDGRQVQKIQLLISQPEKVTSAEVRIYEESGTGSPGTPIIVQSFTPDPSGDAWTEVMLTLPYIVDGSQEILVGYFIETTGGNPAACDAGPTNSDADFMIWSGDWAHLPDLNPELAYNWNIKTGIGDAVDNDAILTAVILEDIILEGDTDIAGTVMNGGNTQVTAFDLNWQLDAGAINTETIDGLAIDYAGTYDFLHGTQWTATEGAYDLKVWISNINGAGADENPDNDEIQKTITVATQEVQRIGLYEEFTASTCPPCAIFNETYFNEVYRSNNAGNFTLIKNQTSFPGAGDPYYTSEGGGRTNYYGVNSVPTLYLDAKKGTHWDSGDLQDALDNANIVPAYIDVEGVHQFDGDEITVNATITPYLSGEYTVQIVVVENETTGNATSNGETSFSNVMMKYLPDPGGTSIECVAGTPIDITESFDMSLTFIEDINDLSVVIFVEDQNKKQIFQSAYSVGPEVGIETQETSIVQIYPNPANENITIFNAKNADIQIYNITGSLLISENNIDAHHTISVSDLSVGTYFVKVIKGTFVETQIISIVK